MNLSKEKTKTNPLNVFKIKGYRTRSGISPEQLSEKLNLGKCNYYQRERGSVYFSINDLITFTKETNLNLEEFIDLFNDPILSELLTNYKIKTIQETEKKEKEIYLKLLEEKGIDI